MKKPLLSIIVPCAPNRTQRVKTIISRLSLNKGLHPEIPFELIIVDGGSTDELKEICMAARVHLDIKYIYLPLYQFINPSYPRNVGFRIAEGDIFTMLDADYWVGEDFIVGATKPFLNGDRDIINNGYVIDTSENNRGGQRVAEHINSCLLDSVNLKKTILSLYDVCNIPKPCEPKHIWLWSAPRQNYFKMNGYDEKYVLGGWCREDDDFFYRTMETGLKRHKNEYDKFCCLHMWHEQGVRSNANVNREYYSKVLPSNFIRNINHQWGKMLAGSYCDIGGTALDHYETEEWIETNQSDVVSYKNEKPWKSIEELKQSIEKS